MLPRFLDLMDSEILFCCATAATKTALGITQLWFNYFTLFRGIFLQGTWRTLSREAKEREAPVVCAFTPVSLSVYRDDHDQFANLSVPCQNAMLLNTHTSQPNHPAF